MAWHAGPGKFVGSDAELLASEIRPALKKTPKANPYRRVLNVALQELKRKRRDNWAGLPERGRWTDADAGLLTTARMPRATAQHKAREKAQPGAWAECMIQKALDDPAQGRIMLKRDKPKDWTHGRIVGEGGRLGADVEEPTVKLRLRSMAARFNQASTNNNTTPPTNQQPSN